MATRKFERGCKNPDEVLADLQQIDAGITSAKCAGGSLIFVTTTEELSPEQEAALLAYSSAKLIELPPGSTEHDDQS